MNENAARSMIEAHMTGKLPPDVTCPVCRKTSPFSPTKQWKGTGTQALVDAGGNARPVLTIKCTHCSFLLLFDANDVGLVSS